MLADNICRTTAVVAELSVCQLFMSAALMGILGFLVGGNADSSFKELNIFKYILLWV